MGILYIKNKICPFCNKQLKSNIVNCTPCISLPCLECKECKIYLYTESNYNVLKELANNRHRKLNHDVYKYKEVKQQNKNKLDKANAKNRKQKPNKTISINHKKNLNLR